MICIAIPSRGRPEYVESLTSSALSTASDPKNVVIKYYLNDNDKTIEDYKKTLGCVALKKNDLLILLKLINKNTKIQIL